MAGVAILFTLWFVVGAFIYFALVRQITARVAVTPEGERPVFEFAEAILAGIMILWFLILSIASVSSPSEDISDRAILGSLVITLGVVALIVFLLKIRGRDVATLAGFSKIGAVRAIITGAILLMFSYPLILVADRLSQLLVRDGFSRQGIVELFSSSQSINQRILIILFAVTLAPAAEEFIFRFFIYGVLKRYFGLAFALVANALLFAAVHGHLPSFAALFVLASCFTIAYEWSGSLLVSMTMHSIFNALTLVFLAFPDIFHQ